MFSACHEVYVVIANAAPTNGAQPSDALQRLRSDPRLEGNKDVIPRKLTRYVLCSKIRQELISDIWNCIEKGQTYIGKGETAVFTAEIRREADSKLVGSRCNAAMI